MFLSKANFNTHICLPSKLNWDFAYFNSPTQLPCYYAVMFCLFDISVLF